jgi:methylglutaconyl-CoA hydratase
MQYLKYHVQDRIGFIVLNRPEKRNALNHDLVSELRNAFRQAEADDSVKVIVLKAEGEAFCAGADLGYLQSLQKFSHEENLADSNHLKELFLKIYTLPKVVIAQVQGHALAGGCGLAAVCDFSFAVPEAKFGYTEVKIGFIPAIVMVFLTRKLGEKKAKQLLLTGDLIKAEEAASIDLISKVVAKDQLETEVQAFAQRLIKNNSGQSMGLTKQMIARVQSLSLEDGLDYAAAMNAEARASADCKKGIAAFLNKEELNW